MNDAERENEIFIKLKLYFEIAITHNGPPSGFFFGLCHKLYDVENFFIAQQIRGKKFCYYNGKISYMNEIDDQGTNNTG